MIRVGIAGSTGYTGAELIKLVWAHPETELSVITSKSYEGKHITEVFPGLRRCPDLICQPLDVVQISNQVDVMFLALPHKVSMHWAPRFLEQGVKVVDLSADFRFQDAAVYEAAYQPHSSADLLEKSVYGLCEIYHDRIRSADLIGNPGCYPTSILLPLVPLLKKGMISSKGIVADSKSGVSGAGRSVSLGTHFCELNEGFKAYKVEGHRHTPEIEAILSDQSGQPVRMTFIPHLLPLTRGMLSTIYADTVQGVTREQVIDALTSYYSTQPFVRILKAGQFPDIAHVRHTNCCDIGVHANPDTGKLIIISAIDNLLKGAAGQAVQNMNIMMGLDQSTGLLDGQGVL